VRLDGLNEIDGPMLQHRLQAFRDTMIQVPSREPERPDRGLLESGTHYFGGLVNWCDASFMNPRRIVLRAARNEDRPSLTSHVASPANLEERMRSPGRLSDSVRSLNRRP